MACRARGGGEEGLNKNPHEGPNGGQRNLTWRLPELFIYSYVIGARHTRRSWVTCCNARQPGHQHEEQHERSEKDSLHADEVSSRNWVSASDSGEWQISLGICTWSLVLRTALPEGYESRGTSCWNSGQGSSWFGL